MAKKENYTIRLYADDKNLIRQLATEENLKEIEIIEKAIRQYNAHKNDLNKSFREVWEKLNLAKEQLEKKGELENKEEKELQAFYNKMHKEMKGLAYFSIIHSK